MERSCCRAIHEHSTDVSFETPDSMIVRSNKALHATATVLSDFVRARKHNTVVAVASALPVAVRELGR